jgi:ABC-2 type transport system ATP-binding protein
MTEEIVADDAVRAEGLGARYGGRWALRDCTFSVPRGAVAVLAGPNGAGKSTLLSIAAGLTVPAAGRMSVLGEDVTARMHPRAAFVAQSRTLPAGLTVREIIRMAGSLNGGQWAPGDFVARLIEDGGIPLKTKAGTLSDGARSLVSIALALSRRPDVLLLDEPFAALDPLARDEVLRILMSEVADRGMTIFLSSHVPGELRAVCDHLVLLGRGEIALTGAIDDLVAEHRVLTGPPDAEPPIGRDAVIHRGGNSLLVRGHADAAAGWESEPAGLDAIVLGYLRATRA